MGMFKRTKAQSGTTVGGDLFTNCERDRVDALWRLTTLPPATRSRRPTA